MNCGEYKNEDTLKQGLWWLNSIRESEASRTYVRNPHEFPEQFLCRVHDRSEFWGAMAQFSETDPGTSIIDNIEGGLLENLQGQGSGAGAEIIDPVGHLFYLLFIRIR